MYTLFAKKRVKIGKKYLYAFYNNLRPTPTPTTFETETRRIEEIWLRGVRLNVTRLINESKEISNVTVSHETQLQ